MPSPYRLGGAGRDGPRTLHPVRSPRRVYLCPELRPCRPQQPLSHGSAAEINYFSASLLSCPSWKHWDFPRILVQEGVHPPLQPALCLQMTFQMDTPPAQGGRRGPLAQQSLPTSPLSCPMEASGSAGAWPTRNSTPARSLPTWVPP